MKPKGRPKKVRVIEKPPKVGQFSPRGRPGRPDEIELTLDQLEVLRLVDYQRLKQRQAATHLGLSRQSIGRILNEARRAVSDALINAKIIRITGGNVRFKKAQSV